MIIIVENSYAAYFLSLSLFWKPWYIISIILDQ